ncbi:MAG: hypothetical protein LUG98_05190, partial [Tannerellaceae bacterium]|nr:hypothetical protein [Tannerellaceae bacterium]
VYPGQADEIERMRKEIQAAQSCTPEEATAHLLRQLLYLYCETRLIHLIKTLCCRLADQSPPDIHRELALRHLQLTTIAGILPTAHWQ